MLLLLLFLLCAVDDSTPTNVSFKKKYIMSDIHGCLLLLLLLELSMTLLQTTEQTKRCSERPSYVKHDVTLTSTGTESRRGQGRWRGCRTLAVPPFASGHSYTSRRTTCTQHITGSL